MDWEHPIFANISVGEKHYGSKSLLITNKLSAVMLRPSNIGMYDMDSTLPAQLVIELRAIAAEFLYITVKLK